MMTLQEVMTPSHEPDALQKVSDTLEEIYKRLADEGKVEFLDLAVMAAASELLEVFARHRREETAQPAAAGTEPLTSFDI